MTGTAWHCEISGSGDFPLVFVHGWCCEGSQFTELAKAFEPSYRVHRPDLPGHGRTPLGDFRPGFSAYADALADWIRRRKLGNPVLVGHSMGGVLALMAATRVAVSAVINLDGSLPAADTTLAAQAKLRSWLDEPGFRERLAAAIRDGYFLPHEHDGRAEEVIRSMCSAPEPVLRFLPETIGELDPAQILPQIQVPVMYIGAENPRYDADLARALLPRLRLEHIRGAGHFLHMRAPGQVVEMAAAFLNPSSRAA